MVGGVPVEVHRWQIDAGRLVEDQAVAVTDLHLPAAEGVDPEGDPFRPVRVAPAGSAALVGAPGLLLCSVLVGSACGLLLAGVGGSRGWVGDVRGRDCSRGSHALQTASSRPAGTAGTEPPVRATGAVTPDGRRVLGWAVGQDGRLAPVGVFEGVPQTVAGLAAR